MGYLYPVPFTHSTSWGAHTRRRPPSTEPGIDMFCAIGTPVLAAADGRVVDVGDSIRPATGRFVTIDLDDGRRVRYLHLSRRTVKVGDRVKRGDVVGYSGATGYGEEDWSWNVAETGGAHVHMTLWPTQRYVFGSAGTLDPQLYFDAATAAATTSKPFEEDSMTAADADRVIAEMTKLVNDQFANFLQVPGTGYGYPQSTDQKVDALAAAVAKVASGQILFAPDAPYYLGPSIANAAREGNDTAPVVQVTEEAVVQAIAPLLPAHVGALPTVDLDRLIAAASAERARRTEPKS